MTDLLVVADIRLYREGLEAAIGGEPEFDSTRSAANVAEALREVERLPPDVVLVDLAMADALTLLGQIARRAPAAAVIALTVPSDECAAVQCAEAGAAGYVTRDGSVDDVVAAIRAAARGEFVCTPRVAGALSRRVATLASATPAINALDSLTRRQRQILELIAQGHANKRIATQLGIELATVKNHVHHILEKLQVEGRGQAAALLNRALHARD